MSDTLIQSIALTSVYTAASILMLYKSLGIVDFFVKNLIRKFVTKNRVLKFALSLLAKLVAPVLFLLIVQMTIIGVVNE